MYQNFVPFYGWINSILCVYPFCLSIPLLIDTWVVFTFWVLWIMLWRIWAYKYLSEFLLLILLDICLKWVARSYGNFRFNSLRKLHTIFHSSCTILHLHQRCTKVPISPHPWWHCYFMLLGGVIIILMNVKWYLPTCVF